MKLPRPTMYQPGPGADPYGARTPHHGAGRRGGVGPAAYTMSPNGWMRYTDCLDDAQMEYDCPPGRNDCFIYPKGAENGLQNFHVHEFSALNLAGNMLISSLLPKSGAFRTGLEPDLANYPIDQWAGLVQNMDGSTRAAVAAIGDCLTRIGAVYS